MNREWSLPGGTLSRIALGDNDPRFLPGARAGHVESWFLRANDPERPRAVWLKATILAPTTGTPTARVWAVLFDGTTGRTHAEHTTVPLAEASFVARPPLDAGALGSMTARDGPVDRQSPLPSRGGAPADVAIGAAGARFRLGALGEAAGTLRGCGWDLTWQAPDSPLAAPLCLFPHRKLLETSLPKSKALTPHPLLTFDGELRWGGERLVVRDWIGMQGHNWGREHAHEYAWGQCTFRDAHGRPHVSVEGFSGRIRVAGRVTPCFSSLVVRRGAQAWRFDRLFDFWRQRAEVGDLRWHLHLRGSAGEAQLVMEAQADRTVCLGYHDPGGHRACCFNSKLARAHLRVNPADDDAFECHAEHDAALEILREQTDPRFEVV